MTQEMEVVTSAEALDPAPSPPLKTVSPVPNGVTMATAVEEEVDTNMAVVEPPEETVTEPEVTPPPQETTPPVAKVDSEPVDLIEIDDEDIDQDGGQVGLTPMDLDAVETPSEEKEEKEKPGVDEKEKGIMDEVDEVTKKLIEAGNEEEEKTEIEGLKGKLKEINRNGLEDIILHKVIESVNTHSVVGNLRSKCLHLHGLKDKLFQKSGVLQKQVTEMTKALDQYKASSDKHPNSQKPPPPLKFYRSVGLQVNVESFGRATASRNAIRMTDSNSNALMKQMASSPATPSPSNPPTSPTNSTNQGVKRVNKPTITVAELRNQVGGSGTTAAKVQKTNTSGAIRPQPILPRTTLSMNGIAKNVTTAAASGLIDLTDEKGNIAPGVILNQNGANFRVINQTGIPQGMQLVSSPTGYHLVSPQGQTRPVVFQQVNSNRQASPQTGQPVGGGGRFRGVPTRSPLNQPQRGGAGLPPRQVARISNTGGMNGVLGASNTFALPTLPAPTTSNVNRNRASKDSPPQPELTLNEQEGGIVLSWTHRTGQNQADIASYQIFACQQPLVNPPGGSPPPEWKRVGDVRAMALPMACTLSQFSDENRYHFIVRGLDIYNRSGPFCEINSIVLRRRQQ